MNIWNITGPKMYIDQVSQSKYYQKSMGQSLTVERNNNRELREGLFTSWYHKNYMSLIFKTGQIGSLHFYIDYYLKKDILGFFLGDSSDDHQYAIEWDQGLIDDLGIDSWLSVKLQEIDETISGVDKNGSDNLIDNGDSNNLQLNPGSVSWKDIEDYYKKKKNM